MDSYEAPAIEDVQPIVGMLQGSSSVPVGETE